MRCAIVGAGAIGKSVAGYAFGQAGFAITFLDATPSVVDDLRSRGHYLIWEGGESPCKVSGIDVYAAGTSQAQAVLAAADIIVTAVGASGFPAAAENIAKACTGSPSPISIFLFENDPSCPDILANAFGGQLPPHISMYKASIERMSRILAEGGAYDVVCEPYIPIIVDQKARAGCHFLSDTRLFMLVDDVSKYYARKLYTNNLGHAVLGFWGLATGCATSVEAIRVPDVRKRVQQALEESAEMCVHAFGFDINDMRAHIADLIDHRYAVPQMADPLARLVRDPEHKLGYDERLISAARRCMTYGIYPRAILETIGLALDKLAAKNRKEETLRSVCGLSQGDPLWIALMAK